MIEESEEGAGSGEVDIETGRPHGRSRRKTTSARHKVKRRSNTLEEMITIRQEDKHKSPASPKTTGQGSGSNWTEIDLIKNQDEINKERKIKRQKMKLLYKEIDSGVVSVNIVQELKDVIYYSELYKDTCDKLAHYKEQRRINGYRPRLPCSPCALLPFPPHPTHPHLLSPSHHHCFFFVAASTFGWLMHKLTCQEEVDAIIEYKAMKKVVLIYMFI